MIKSEFRIWAKCVAITELILNSIAVLAVIRFGTGFIFGGVGAFIEDEEQQLEHSDTVWTAVISIILLVTIGSIVICMWFSYNLFRATAIEVDPTEAIKNSNRWRIMAIVLLLVSVLSLGKVDNLAPKIGGIICRVVFIWIVQMYIKDLEIAQQQCIETGKPSPGKV